MSVELALAFIGSLLLLVMVPGPAILMVVGRSLSSGARSTFSLVCGILLGDVFYMAIVFMGLVALGQVLGEFFVFLRILAGLFLIYLGISFWRKDPQKQQPRTASAPSGDTWANFFTGFGITLGNPKAMAFPLGFLPAFFDLPALTLTDILAIMAIFVAVIGAVFAVYAGIASKARALAGNRGHMRLLNRCAGTLLIGVGMTVLLKSS